MNISNSFTFESIFCDLLVTMATPLSLHGSALSLGHILEHYCSYSNRWQFMEVSYLSIHFQWGYPMAKQCAWGKVFSRLKCSQQDLYLDGSWDKCKSGEKCRGSWFPNCFRQHVPVWLHMQLWLQSTSNFVFPARPKVPIWSPVSLYQNIYSLKESS